MRTHPIVTVAKAARSRLAAVVLAAALVVMGGAPLAAAAAVAAQPSVPPGYLGGLAVLTDLRGAGGVALAVDPTTDKVYVASAVGPDLGVLDPLTGQQTGSITLPGIASTLAVDPETDTIYAVTGPEIAVLNGITGKLTTTVADASSPSQLAVDPATNRLYVTNTSSNTITVIDGSTDTVATTISADHPLTGITADPATDTIYAASGDGTVSVIDGDSNTVTGTITVGGAQGAITVNPRTGLVYSAGPTTIAVIDGGTRTVTATIDKTADFLAADPETDTIYLASFPAGGISALDGRTNNVIAKTLPAGPVFPPPSPDRQPSPADAPTSGPELAVNPAAGTIYSIYTVEEEFGPVAHLQVAGSCVSGGPISAGTACAQVAAGFQAGTVSFTSPARGVAFGGLGCGPNCLDDVLMATTDGGKHWNFLPAPPPAPVFVTIPPQPLALFTSLRDGWLYGQLHTGDGGVTWQRDPPVKLTQARMAATATTIYAVTRLAGKPADGLFTTPVGGTTWTRVPGISALITGLAVSGPSVWLAATTHLFATADGRHWHRYPARCPGTGFKLTGVAAASPSHVAFLCTRPGPSGAVAKEVLTSADGGRTVHLAGSAPANGTPEFFASPPGNPAVITIASDAPRGRPLWIYRSANRGASWTTRTFQLKDLARFDSLTYTSATAGWLTFDGTLLHTTDSGRTWHPANP
jgi:YVTN family beta-propeller protein